jgi:hydroxymethylglutaryl-CoA lyase
MMAHLLLRPVIRCGRTHLRVRHLRGLATTVDPTLHPAQEHNHHISGDRVRITEVGPRDGLQNEKKTIPLATKLELIERLARTGLTDIEAGSFVAPKWVPQVHRPF